MTSADPHLGVRSIDDTDTGEKLMIMVMTILNTFVTLILVMI